MADWFSTPLIVIAAIALGSLVIGGAYRVGKWVAAVDSDRSALRDAASRDREVVSGFMREMHVHIRTLHEGIQTLQEDSRTLREGIQTLREDSRALWEGIRTLREDIRTLQEDIRTLQEQVVEIFSRLGPAPVQQSSPLRLTNFGEDIARDLDARHWASQVATEMVSKVKGLEPFEVDEFCGRYVREDLDDEWKRQVARCAFEFGIDRPGVLSVLQVVLRETLLESLQGP